MDEEENDNVNMADQNVLNEIAQDDELANIISSKMFDCCVIRLEVFLKDLKIFKTNFAPTSAYVKEDSLYLMNKETKKIDVIDINTKLIKPSIDFKNINSPNQAYSFTFINNVLFIYHDDENKTIIYKYDIDTLKFVEWNRMNNCRLSQSGQRNVLARTKQKISEYSLECECLQNIEIPIYTNLLNTFQLNNGRYIDVSFSDKKLYLSLLDEKGNSIKNVVSQIDRCTPVCTDYEKYILILHSKKGIMEVFTTELDEISTRRKLLFRGARNIFYDRENKKFLVSTDNHTCYFKIDLKSLLGA